MSNEVKGQAAPQRVVERTKEDKHEPVLPAGVEVVEADTEPKARPRIERPNSSFAQEAIEPKQELRATHPVEEGLISYVNQMRDAKSTEEVDAAQMTLYRLVLNVLDTPDHAKFKEEWSMILNFVAEHDEITQITLRRGINRWQLDTIPHRAYNTLLFVICQTSSMSQRFSYLNNVDVTQINADIAGLCPNACSNINTFYNV